MNSLNLQHSTKRLVLIGLFSAICYVTLYFKIPLPAPVGTPFLHMGNMFVLLAALLFSGSIGGLSGSIGMGLFDLMNGYARFVPKVLVLKFGMGIVAGAIASKGHKKNATSPVKWLSISAAVLMAFAAFLTCVTFIYGPVLSFEGVERTFNTVPVIVFAFVLGLLLMGVCLVIKRITIVLQYAILGAVAGIAFNLVGEFLWGLGTLLLLGSGFVPAIISAAISLPATLINGTASIIVAIMLYIPLSKITKRFHLS